MSTIAFDQFALTRIADFARTLSRLHQASRRRAVDDDEIDREFNAVCAMVPPAVRPIQPLALPPLGTSQCSQRQVLNPTTRQYEWRSVCN